MLGNIVQESPDKPTNEKVADETLVGQPTANFRLETGTRLSQSCLWKLQRNYFDQQGIRAWNEAVVPHYITSNPWIASAYAKVVFGWLRDYHAAGMTDTAPPPLDADQPVYIVELGCGSGRFGYLFLNKLLGLLNRSVLKGQAIKYVYTDFTEYNLDILRSHPSLQTFVDAGLLDFACFDLELDHELQLSHSGELLSAATIKNPLVVLANYVFDGVRQDCFWIGNGQLHASLVNVESSQEESDLSDPEIIERLRITYERQPVAADYYNNPAWNHILDSYRQRLTDTVVLFPYAALTCLEHLCELSSNRLLLLSGDKGDIYEESLLNRTEPYLDVHGSFSLSVNYHAIGQRVVSLGGEFLRTSHRHSNLNIVAGLLGNLAGGYVETRLAYDEAIENQGPDDFFCLKKNVEQNYRNFTAEQLVGYLRLTGWDHNILLGCFPALMECVRTAPLPLLDEFRVLVRNVWQTYFPIREPNDLAFHLGLLLYAMQDYEDALEFFQYSLQLYGPDQATAVNMAVCHFNLGQLAEAQDNINLALDLAPELEVAHDLANMIQAAMK